MTETGTQMVNRMSGQLEEFQTKKTRVDMGRSKETQAETNPEPRIKPGRFTNSFTNPQTTKYLLGVIMFYLYGLYVGNAPLVLRLQDGRLGCCCRRWIGTEALTIIGMERTYTLPGGDFYMRHDVLCVL